MENTLTKEQIIETLGKASEERIQKDLRKYKTYEPTDKFRTLWKDHKEEIKEAGFIFKSIPGNDKVYRIYEYNFGQASQEEYEAQRAAFEAKQTINRDKILATLEPSEEIRISKNLEKFIRHEPTTEFWKLQSKYAKDIKNCGFKVRKIEGQDKTAKFLVYDYNHGNATQEEYEAYKKQFEHEPIAPEAVMKTLNPSIDIRINSSLEKYSVHIPTTEFWDLRRTKSGKEALAEAGFTVSRNQKGEYVVKNYNHGLATQEEYATYKDRMEKIFGKSSDQSAEIAPEPPKKHKKKSKEISEGMAM